MKDLLHSAQEKTSAGEQNTFVFLENVPIWTENLESYANWRSSLVNETHEEHLYKLLYNFRL